MRHAKHINMAWRQLINWIVTMCEGSRSSQAASKARMPQQPSHIKSLQIGNALAIRLRFTPTTANI